MEVDQSPGTSGTSSSCNTNPLKQLTLPKIDENNTLEEKSGKERLLEMLDMMEAHVERLRQEAAHLEEEKDGLLASLDTLRHTDTLRQLEDSERDDVLRYSDRIVSRCHTVHVHVHTQRDPTQEEALFQINHLIDGLVVGLRCDPDGSKARCLAYMNACSAHLVQGATDKNFESALLGCTLDDQKRVKKRLQGLLHYFDKLESAASKFFE